MGGKKHRSAPVKPVAIAVEPPSKSVAAITLYTDYDHDRPIEEHAGILGYSWDGQLVFIDDCLSPLKEIQWNEYFALLDDQDGQAHTLSAAINEQTVSIDVKDVYDVAQILDQSGILDVSRDNGPVNASPASGSGYLFFLREGDSPKIVRRNVNALVDAISEDFRRLKT